MMSVLEPLGLLLLAGLGIYLVFRRHVPRRPCGPAAPADGCAGCPMKGQCPAPLTIEPIPGTPGAEPESAGSPHPRTEPRTKAHPGDSAP